MKILYDKNKFQIDIIKQINDLFIFNYMSYHYKNLTSLEGIQNLLEDDTFNCVCICEDEKVVGFAGYYEQSEIVCPIRVFKLAHLLVDINSRGKGLGTILEDSRLQMINHLHGEKVIYASCVENPKNSIYMKLNRGFRINGFRYHYRNTNNTKENALVLVNTDAIINKRVITVNVNNYITREILRRGNPDIIFSVNQGDLSNKEIVNVEAQCNMSRDTNYNICFFNDEQVGRIIGRIYCNQASTKNISLPSTFKHHYISILVSPSIRGFDVVDSYLLKNGFYPICYIPYINDYYGELEYQYLPYGVREILSDISVSGEGQTFIREISNNIMETTV